MLDPTDSVIVGMFAFGGIFAFFRLRWEKKQVRKKLSLAHIAQMEREMGLDRKSQIRHLTERAGDLQREIDGLRGLVDVSVDMEHRRLSVAKLEKQTELDDLMDEINALRGIDAITT